MPYLKQAQTLYEREQQLVRGAGYPIEPAGMFDPRSDIENRLLRLASEVIGALGRVQHVAKGRSLLDSAGAPVLDSQGKRLDEDMAQLGRLAEAAKNKLESAAIAAAMLPRGGQDAEVAE